VSILRAHV